RLAQECLGARRPCGAPGLVRAADRDDRDLARLRRLAQALQGEDPVDPRKPDVEQERGGSRLDENALRPDHVIRHVDVESLELERRPDQLTQQPVVVDDQYPTLAPHSPTPEKSLTATSLSVSATLARLMRTHLVRRAVGNGMIFCRNLPQVLSVRSPFGVIAPGPDDQKTYGTSILVERLYAG